MTSTSADLQQSFNQKKIQKYKNLRQSMREKQMQTHFCIQCNEATSPLIELLLDRQFMVHQTKKIWSGRTNICPNFSHTDTATRRACTRLTSLIELKLTSTNDNLHIRGVLLRMN